MAGLSTTEALSSANALLAAHYALIDSVCQAQQSNRRSLNDYHSPPPRLLDLPSIDPPSPASSTSSLEHELPPTSPPQNHTAANSNLPPAKRARVARYKNYVPDEETIRNDYSQRYVDGGEWPQNWVLGAEPEHRFEEYPKQQRLLALKKAEVAAHALPPYYLLLSELQTLQPTKFDVILLDPPYSSSFGWDHLQELPIPQLAADPSFIFLWVGSGAGEGLERGREVLAKWGYRRCEDVVWVKTNKYGNKGPGTDPPTTSLLTRTKQHCLIGIRGTVRRSTDSWFVHCNVDTDVIIWEGSPTDPTLKPPEMYTLIENFCLGLRRLEIFGRSPSSFRPGWITILGHTETDPAKITGAVHWDRESWDQAIQDLSQSGGGKAVVPMSSEIDALRPKSPVRGQGQNGHANTNAHNGQQNGPRFSSPAQNQIMMRMNPMMGMNGMGMMNGVMGGMMNMPGMPGGMPMNTMGMSGMAPNVMAGAIGMGNMGMGFPSQNMPMFNNNNGMDMSWDNGSGAWDPSMMGMGVMNSGMHMGNGMDMGNMGGDGRGMWQGNGGAGY